MGLFTSVYKKILLELPTGVVLFDAKGRILFSNAAFRSHFPVRTVWTRYGGVAKAYRGKENAGQFAAFFRRIQDGEHSAILNIRVTAEGETFEAALRMQGKAIGRHCCLGVVESVYEQELARELTGAQNIQQRLLPAGEEAAGVPYSFMYVPCREIGGDLPDVYEVCSQSGRSTFGVIADVSGKGIAAGMLSSFVKAGFDRSEPSPAKAIAKLNVKFQELNQDEKAYITVAAVRIDGDRQTVCYSIAGHNAPILLKNGLNVSEIEMAAPPVSNWFSDFSYEDRELAYEKGDLLVLLTDGVTESRNAEGEQFGIERVENVLIRCASARQFIDELRAELAEFCGTFDDDITAIAFDL